MSDNRSRVTVYPLDAWRRRMVSPHEPAPGIKVWWFMPECWTRIPPTYDHVGYVERGAGEGYDRGALLRRTAVNLEPRRRRCTFKFADHTASSL